MTTPRTLRVTTTTGKPSAMTKKSPLMRITATSTLEGNLARGNGNGEPLAEGKDNIKYA